MGHEGICLADKSYNGVPLVVPYNSRKTLTLKEDKTLKKPWKKLTPAMTFIIMFGVVSMFSDITHEGAAGIYGAYLSLLGASAATIGFVSGLGELVGYSLRFVFGALTDKTKKYWPMVVAGYFIDMVAVPMLALVSENGWLFACMILVIERMGKAIKKPAKNTLLSFAAYGEGVGKSFAIQEALDQLGAFIGPVMLYIVMLFKADVSTYDAYTFAFAVLAVPAFITLVLLMLTKRKFPAPENFEPPAKEKDPPFHIKRCFVFYLVAISLFAFGFIDFSLITMHVVRAGLLSDRVLPLLYAGAMLIDAVAALFFGWMYDKYGFKALMASTLISAGFAVFVFGFHSITAVAFGVMLWGVGMGAQESILKAAVAGMVPKNNRATGYGIFECAFGLFWFLGSWLMGALYDVSLTAMIVVSVAAQLMAVPLYAISTCTKN